MEILFRAWDKERKEMLPVTSMNWSEWWVSCEPILDGVVHPLDYGERNSFKNEETDRQLLMQYVGIKDRKGNRIFVGDILDAPVEINKERFGERQYYTVGMLDGQYILSVRYLPEKNWAFKEGYQFGYLCKILSYGENGYISDDIEVIGNIYENENLLNECK